MQDKLLYITTINLDDDCSGITRKVYAQFKCFQDTFDSYLIGYSGSGVGIYHNGSIKEIATGNYHRHYAVLKVAIELAKEKEIEKFYIRNLLCDPVVLQSLKKLHNSDGLILWEIPTYPYDYEPKDSLPWSAKSMALLRLKIDQIFRRKLKKYIDRIVTFSHVKEIFEIQTIVTGNGVEVDNIRKRIINNESDQINLIAVAVMRPWHAYDRLIKGLGDYYANGGKRDIVFHVVGDGTVLQNYQNIAKYVGVEERVIFYGFRNKEEIDNIYDKCNLAVESLGWHRSKVPVGTSIKTREYVAKGLPIIASSPMDIFPDGWEFAYYAPIDDSNININDIIEFFDKIYSEFSAMELAEKIRNIAYKKCDMRAMMKPILDYLLKAKK